MAEKSVCGKFSGKIFLKDLQTPLQPYRFLGNATAELSQSVEKSSIPDYTSSAGGNACTDQIISDVELKFKISNVGRTALELALAALVNQGSVVAITNEPVRVFLDEFIPFKNLINLTVPPVVTNVGGVTTYVAGVDYTVDVAGIRVITGSALAIAIAAGSGTPKSIALEVDYTPVARSVYEGLKASGNLYEVVIISENKVNGNAAVRWTFFQSSVSGANTVALIGRDFVEFEVTATLQPDTTIVTTGLSQYYTVQNQTV